MINRDLQSFSEKTYDVLVVGGGIHGATTAYHCAKSGFYTAILEKNDFAAATSANSLKILHGGLRYLQHLNISRMRHSIQARHEMMTLAPGLVQPLPCMMPLYGGGLKGKTLMRMALFANDCIGFDRNRGIREEIRLPRGHVVSKELCLDTVPGLGTRNLHGAAIWYDALGVNTERMVLEYILAATRHGAEAANYAKVTSLEVRDGYYSVDVKDALTGVTRQLKTKYLINGAGPWFEECCSLKKPIKHSRQNWAMALNIVSRKKIFEKYAVALEGKSSYLDKDAVVKRNKRLYFFVPWQDHTMIGTEYEVCRDNPDIFEVKRESIQNMVNEVNAIYPAAKLSYDDISFYHAGLVPMQTRGDEDGIQLEKNSLFFFHEEAGYERVVSIKGVKYTTAPYIARQIVAELSRKMDSKTGTTAYLEESFDAVDRHSFGREDVDEHNLQTEIHEMIENEMVCHLADIIFRRTDLGSAECPDMALLQKITNAMAKLLGWNSSQKQEEIEEVLKRYEPLADRNS